jgi:hypothetical protein
MVSSARHQHSQSRATGRHTYNDTESPAYSETRRSAVRRL